MPGLWSAAAAGVDPRIGTVPAAPEGFFRKNHRFSQNHGFKKR
jgi:hypothetical protein